MLSISIYIYYRYSSTQLCLPARSVLVWMKSRVNVCMRLWILSILYIHIVWTKSRARYIYIATIYLLNSACQQGVCLCGQSRWLICVYVSDTCILSISLPLVVSSTLLADRECACVNKVAIWYVYMYLIYIYIVIIRLPNPAGLLKG